MTRLSHPLRVHGKSFRCGDDPFWAKAVTFGPFPAGHFPDEGIGELARIQNELGANCLRLFEVPSIDFLHACAAHQLRVFITLPWTQHVDFRSDRAAWDDAQERLAEAVSSFKGHPAIAGYFVGNEIRSDLVRFMGETWTRDRLEELIQLGKSIDPDALFSYANYPTTEFLIPRNQDFFAMNVYLEEEESFSSYLHRLMALSGDKPLMLSEIGMDSLRNGEEQQAAVICRSIREAARVGAAGACVFAWSDAWQRGGETIEDWAFGMTRRDGAAKLALAQISDTWGDWEDSAESAGVQPADCDGPLPKVSVLVCTYRGSATLSACLDSLLALDYPDYEIIVVNDGNDSRVAEIVTAERRAILIPTDHIGLSAARNLAASHASGQILIYTDDDCVAEPEWLSHMVEGFCLQPEVSAAGGPNIPPHPETDEQALVQCSPGGPAHVLTSDRLAEHVPGCNLAVRREAFDAVGGFDPRFRAAGDDVDFQWRLLAAGYQIGFFPKAWIWHHRRATFAAYRRQQRGYGIAEALLMEKWLDRFPALGGAVWDGAVYQASPFFSSLVYRGEWSSEAFQLASITGAEAFWAQRLHPLWIGNAAVLILLGCLLPPFLWIGLGALGFTLVAAVLLARASLAASDLTGIRALLRLTIMSLQHGWDRACVRLWRSRRQLKPSAVRQAQWELLQSLVSYPRLAIVSRVSAWRARETALSSGTDWMKRFLETRSPALWHPDPTGHSDLSTDSTIYGVRYELISASEYHGEGTNLLVKVRARIHPLLFWGSLLLLPGGTVGMITVAVLWALIASSILIRTISIRSELRALIP